MSIVEVWHISVSLNINDSRERGLTDTDIYRKCKFQRVWTELNSEFVLSSKPSQNIWDQFSKLSKVGLSMEELIVDSFQFSTSLGRFLFLEGRQDLRSKL